MGAKGRARHTRGYRYRDYPAPVQEKESGRWKKDFQKVDGKEMLLYKFTWAMAIELVHAGGTCRVRWDQHLGPTRLQGLQGRLEPWKPPHICNFTAGPGQ